MFAAVSTMRVAGSPAATSVITVCPASRSAFATVSSLAFAWASSWLISSSAGISTSFPNPATLSASGTTVSSVISVPGVARATAYGSALFAWGESSSGTRMRGAVAVFAGVPASPPPSFITFLLHYSPQSLPAIFAETEPDS